MTYLSIIDDLIRRRDALNSAIDALRNLIELKPNAEFIPTPPSQPKPARQRLGSKRAAIKPEAPQPDGKFKKAGYKCEPCAVSYDYPSRIENHLHGARHKARVAKAAAGQTVAPARKKGQYRCSECPGLAPFPDKKERKAHYYQAHFKNKSKRKGGKTPQTKKNSDNWSYTGARDSLPGEGGLVCGPCRDFVEPFNSKAELEEHQFTVHGSKVVLTNGESR